MIVECVDLVVHKPDFPIVLRHLPLLEPQLLSSCLCANLICKCWLLICIRLECLFALHLLYLILTEAWKNIGLPVQWLNQCAFSSLVFFFGSIIVVI